MAIVQSCTYSLFSLNGKNIHSPKKKESFHTHTFMCILSGQSYEPYWINILLKLVLICLIIFFSSSTNTIAYFSSLPKMQLSYICHLSNT